ncbi:hypothetical protein CRUP_035938 [Coryphaenoides rupestris]|nr:hypothetical protein CRUP_035938 [Coryphaenoides rupestris]
MCPSPCVGSPHRLLVDAQQITSLCSSDYSSDSSDSSYSNTSCSSPNTSSSSSSSSSSSTVDRLRFIRGALLLRLLLRLLRPSDSFYSNTSCSSPNTSSSSSSSSSSTVDRLRFIRGAVRLFGRSALGVSGLMERLAIPLVAGAAGARVLGSLTLGARGSTIPLLPPDSLHNPSRRVMQLQYPVLCAFRKIPIPN